MPSPRTVAVSFVDAINRSDVAALDRLMTEDHTLVVFDEPPLVGRAANIEAWRGYVERFPHYRIHPREIVEQGRTVAVLGHTTGSHLALPDEEERQIEVLWRAEIAGAQVRRWTVTDPL